MGSNRTLWLAAVMAAAAAAGPAPSWFGEAAAPSGPPLPPPRPPVLEAVAPLPPARPADLVQAPPDPAQPPPETTGAPVPAEEEYACLRVFTSGKVVARAVAPLGGAGGCRIAAPVEVSAVVVAPGRRVAVDPPVTIACPLAAVLADWVRDDLAPAFAAVSTPLERLAGTSGYACRGRNGVPGAKLSEHARGDALDLAGFTTAGGRPLTVQQAGAPLLATVRGTACQRFTTVLGPGSDSFHGSHMHVDLAPRRHGGTICQWVLGPDAPPAARGPR